ncbi:MAG TPA: hypothetical protein VJ887_00100 [Actinomycetota bacterium]|nr:hypothetical protein [Actinomycetota bacterium]
MASEPTPSGPRRPRTRGRRVALGALAGLATFAALLVLDGIWAGRSLVRGLTAARSELSIAIESIVTGDPGSAGPHFDAAARAADAARGAVGHPSMGIAGLLPIAGDNIDAAAAVADASRATAEAGTAMVRVARTLGWTDIRIPASTAAGSVDIDAFEDAIPDMEAVTRRLDVALRALEDAGGDGLLGPVASGYRDAVDGLTLRLDLAIRFRDSLRLAVAMFGGEHRYLVCVPTLGIPRPAGGTPATVGVLVAGDGSLALESIAAAPSELIEAESSIDWRRTARSLLEAAETSGLTDLDGVIQIDAVALEDIVWAIGDVEAPGSPEPLSDRTTTRALEIEAFLGTAPARSARLHADRVSTILEAFLDRRPGVESFALATAAGARDGHLSIYLPGGAERRIIRSLGLDGGARLTDDGVLPVAASWSAVGNSHVGALVDTTVRQSIRITGDGSAAVDVEILFENKAGTDPPSVLLGRPVGGIPVGTFAADVTLFVPARAQKITAETSRPSRIEIGSDLGLTSVTGSILVRGGESATLTVTYEVPDAVRTVDGVDQLMLRVLPQPTLSGVRFQLGIVLPDGSNVVSISRELQRRTDGATFTGVRGGSFDLELRFGAGEP